MAEFSKRKRASDGRPQRPSKKQKRMKEYHSDQEREQDRGFNAVNLLNSEDDIHNVMVDDTAIFLNDASSSFEVDVSSPPPSTKMKRVSKSAIGDAPKANEKDDEESEENEESKEGDEYEDEDDSEAGSELSKGKFKSKRNDPSAFANSLSKILSTKLSSSKRSDPFLIRSAEAHEASRAAGEVALEAKARRVLKEQKRQALEKGRVKNVLLASKNGPDGEPEDSTAETLEMERKLREVAKRGVIKMFNAVRAAQVKAAEAERETKNTGFIGMDQREKKVNELSKKGFLDLIASGGGGLKKGALEEA